MKRRPRASIMLGAMLTAGLGIQCQEVARRHNTLSESALIGPTTAAGATTESDAAIQASVVPSELDPIEALARRDPLEFLCKAYDHYKTSVRDYRCTFVKQERVGRKVRPTETAHVMFMEEPYSVLMTWPSSPRPAERVLYIEDKWKDKSGRALAEVHPEPLLALVAPRMKRPIDDRLARSKSRRRIDQFGFARTFDLIIRYCEMAKAEGALKLEYRGRSSVAGRPTHVVVRHLPYTGTNGKYPDRVLVAHIDEEWLLPIAVFTYADDLEKEILGNYVLKDIELNVGLSEADFTLD